MLVAPERWSGLVGHYHLTTSKVDPGPAFDWARLLGDVRARLDARTARAGGHAPGRG